MKESMKERFRFYFNRFIDPKIPLKQKWVSFWRYIGMGFGLIGEKLHGVDYEMIYQEDNGKDDCGNYTMSPKKVLKRIFNNEGDLSNKGFIDVGCGKGFAKMAYKAGFRIVGGVEYNQYLYNICIKNLKKDKIPVDYVICGMAQDYESYNNFDIFYFNNPFEANILSDVLKKIIELRNGNTCRCYYLNPSKEKEDAFINNGFKLIKVIKDPAESYFLMNVYEC